MKNENEISLNFCPECGCSLKSIVEINQRRKITGIASNLEFDIDRFIKAVPDSDPSSTYRVEVDKAGTIIVFEGVPIVDDYLDLKQATQIQSPIKVNIVE